MVGPRSIRRGEIWIVKLDPTIGSEIRETRRCIIVSPPEIHDYLRTAVIAPLTSKGLPAPFRIPIRHGGRNGIILLDQLRAINKSRLWKRAGALSPSHLGTVLAALVELFSEY